MAKTAALFWLFSFLLLVTVLTACAAFEDPSQRATENAQNTEIWERLYDFQEQMPTMEAMAQTADAAVSFSTQLAQANSLNQNYRSTITFLESNPNAARSGSQPTAIGGGQPSGAFPTQSTSGSNPSGSFPTQSTTRAVAGSGGNGSSTTVASDVTTSQGTRFTRSVTGTGRDSDNCATNLQNTFSSSASSIIYSSTVMDVLSGTAFSLRVLSGDRVIGSDPDFWVADGNYDETCIWYEIDRQTMSFTAGTYTVQLLADDEIGATATFVLTGETTGASASSGSSSSTSASGFAMARVGTTLNANNCVETEQSVFSQSAPQIYFSVVATDVVAGTNYGIRVSSDGRVVASEPSFWVSDGTYDETCLWYTLDRSVLVFSIGSYTVELLVDEAVAATVSFSISGGGSDAGGGDEMDEMES